MALRQILTEPNPILHHVSQPVKKFDAALAQLVADMFETMYASDGIGLAAPQIGVLERVLVMDLRGPDGQGNAFEEGVGPFVVINPEICWMAPKKCSYQEGCLSIPEHYVSVLRPEAVKIKYQDLEGNFHECDADSLLAVCIQHEMDHLDGVTLLTHEEAAKKKARVRDMLQPV